MQREAYRIKRSGKKISFVPTMGALHDGHLSLVRLARRKGDIVVMSIYVNPAQFGPREDFSRYPRPFSKDAALAAGAGVNILFAPKDLYNKDDSTRVLESFLSQGRCGAFRTGHFDGVTTVVAKLFNIVQPDVVIFGQKDAQQCDVLKRMVRDLHFPIKLVRAPVIRDRKGLAMSSRNAYLGAGEYQTALNLPRILKQAAKQGPALAVRTAEKLLARVPGLEVQYVEAARGRLCAAVKVGVTRLIDNVPLAAR